MENSNKKTNFGIKIIIEQFGDQWQSIDIYSKRCIVTLKTLLTNLTFMSLDTAEYLIKELGLKVKKK